VSSGPAGSAAATERLLDWLADTGPRWGVPAEACRAHGWLYLGARAEDAAAISAATGLTGEQTRSALSWLEDHRLVARDRSGRWSTGSDPWEIVVASLAARREREIGPAREVLERSRRDAAGDPQLAGRIDGLRRLLEDVAAIDAQAQRLSPAALRRLVGAGGAAARFFDRALGGSKGGRR